MKNYYEILEINENASPEIIEKAYRVLAKKYHPDVQPEDKLYWADINFKEITEAYQVLSNKHLKREYDMQLNSYKSQSPNYTYPPYSQPPFYNNVYNQNQNIGNENSSEKPKKKKSTISSLSAALLPSLKDLFSSIPTFIREQSKKPHDERSKSLKALLLTILIVSILIFIFIKVPFLNKLLFP